MLAGDILKEASDRARAAGRRRAAVPPRLLPPAHRRLGLAARVLGRHRSRPRARRARDRRRRRAADGLACRSCGRDVVAQVWRVDVGRVPLFLLDADRPENSVADRWITSRLYVGDPEHAACAVRAARRRRRAGAARARHRARRRPPQRGPRRVRRARARPPRREQRRRRARTRWPPRASARSSPPTRRCRPATTPTRPRRSTRALAPLVGRPRASSWTRSSAAAARTPTRRPSRSASPSSRCARAARANGVSAPPRRGRARDVARRCGPTAPSTTSRSRYVTNGVHIPTWIGGPMRELLDRHLGAGWLDRADRPGDLGARVDRHPGRGAVGRAPRAARDELIELVRDRSVDRPARPRRARSSTSEAAADAFDPDVLTIGFARRLATYKRLDLLLSATSTARSALLGDEDRPVQLADRRQGAPARRRRQAARAAPVRA